MGRDSEQVDGAWDGNKGELSRRKGSVSPVQISRLKSFYVTSHSIRCKPLHIHKGNDAGKQ